MGIVALPLAIAFGIASGVSPEQGLITAIIAGFIISFLGGTTVQIGGPTGSSVFLPLTQSPPCCSQRKNGVNQIMKNMKTALLMTFIALLCCWGCSEEFFENFISASEDK